MGNIPSSSSSEDESIDLNRLSQDIIEEQKGRMARLVRKYAAFGDILGFVIPAIEAKRAIYYTNDSLTEKIRCLTSFDIFQAIEESVNYPFVVHHSRQGYIRVLYVHQPKRMTSL